MSLLSQIAAEASSAFSDFDERVTWTPQGGSAEVVNGIVDLQSELLELGEILEQDGVAGLINFATARVPGIAIDDALIVREATYRVIGVEPDGTGRTMVVYGV